MRELMKDVGKTLRPMGFRGSVNSWTKVTDHGLASVGKSDRNNWIPRLGYSPDVRGFLLGAQAVPEPWWTYQNWRRKRHGEDAVPIDHPRILGPGLLDYHGLPAEPVSPTRLWTIRPNWVSQGELSGSQDDIAFARENLPWAAERLARRALELIEPGRYLKELLNQPLKEIGDWEPIVVLLAEYGPSSALEDAIAGLRSSHAERGAEDHAEEIVSYAHSR
ncbi:MAG: hypothetical protein ACRD0P_16890 [Stackebrandtia sp.]